MVPNDQLECEHILPLLPATMHLGLVGAAAEEWEQNARQNLVMEYAWSHKCCNQIKRSINFVTYNPATTFYEINEDIIQDFNIRIRRAADGQYPRVCRIEEFTNIRLIPQIPADTRGARIRAQLQPILDAVNNTIYRISQLHNSPIPTGLIYALLCMYKLISAFSNPVFFNDVFLDWPSPT